MRLKILVKLVVISLLIPMSNLAIAANDLGDDGMIDHDFKEKKWKEQDVEIPPLPKSKNLVRLQFPHSQRKYFIDLKSVSVGKKDRVARYTVIIESQSGVINRFYEGLRCHEKDYKIYAYSVGKQKFQKMSVVEWQPIVAEGVRKYRQVLFDHYICDNAVVRYKAKDIIQVLKYPPDNHAP